MTIQDLLEKAAAGAEVLREAQAEARPAAVRAVRALEAALSAALSGEPLRGLPSLRGRYAGARVRGKRIDGHLTEAPALVIARDGRLKMARAVPVPEGEALRTEERPAEDAELLAEDAEDVSRALLEVLQRHVALLERRTEDYRRMRSLAERLEAALR